MYIRQVTRKNKDGSSVTYVQLAHNRRGDGGVSVAEVLYNFGRKDQIDLDALNRLVDSVQRFLGLSEAGDQPIAKGEAGLRMIDSRPMGAAWVLHGLWKQLRVDRALAGLWAKRGQGADPTGPIFAMVANRALAAASKHAIPDWVANDVLLPEVEALTDDQLYRAMDFLISSEAKLQEEVFFSAADLLNLRVDLLLYDTTSSYFEMEDDDEELIERQNAWDAFKRGEGPQPLTPEPQIVNDPPLRMKGHSKDHRPDLAQVVIGLAVTREGIPVRVWTWPGNTADTTTVETVKNDLRGWKLNRVVWAVDRGFVSEENLKRLRSGGAHYIGGKKLRSGEADVEEALSRAGRFQHVADNLEVKEIFVGEDDARRRLVLVRNPFEAKRHQEQRERALKRVRDELAALPADQDEHSKAVCKLMANPTLGRYLKPGPKGLPIIDKAKVKAEERLDGKYLLITSDDTIPAADVAQSYKQLAEVERAWRCLKSELDIRPMYHRVDARIRAHVLLCWLALLLIRVAEVKTGKTWTQLRAELDRMHCVTYDGASGRLAQRTEITEAQKKIFADLGVLQPPRFRKLQLAEPSA
jgi:hypothetical protein